MKLQIFKILALLNAAATVSATTAAGAPPLANPNRAHGTNRRSIDCELRWKLGALDAASRFQLVSSVFFLYLYFLFG